jgi:hypothetical protein
MARVKAPPLTQRVRDALWSLVPALLTFNGEPVKPVPPDRPKLGLKRPRTRNGKARRLRRLYGKKPTQFMLRMAFLAQPRTFAFKPKVFERERVNDFHWDETTIRRVFDALWDEFEHFLVRHKNGQSRPDEEADFWEWMAHDEDGPFGFVNVCASQGRNPHRLREGLERFRPEWHRELDDLPPRIRQACLAAVLADFKHQQQSPRIDAAAEETTP